MVFLVFALVTGVATAVAIFSIIQAMRLELGNELDRFGPNIVITPRFQGAAVNYGGTDVAEVMTDVKPLSESDLQWIRTIADRDSVNLISPKLVGAATMNQRQVLLVGVVTSQEFMMKPWFSFRESIDSGSDGISPKPYQLDLPNDGLLLGSGIAEAFSLKAGDTVIINERSFRIFGIFKDMGTEEDSLVYARLAIAQDILRRPGMLTMIEVSGYCNFCPIEDMAAQIAYVLPNSRVTALRQAALIREETINRFSIYGFVLSGVVLLVASLVVLTTMLSSVNEQTREIGIFRAIGFRQMHIIGIIESEALLVSALAGALGYLAGIATAMLAGSYLAQMQIDVAWNPNLIVPSMLLAIVLACLSSLYPAAKAARLDPVTTLRYF